MAVMLLTEQCLQWRLHLSVRMMVPRMGSSLRNKIDRRPKRAKYRKEEAFKRTILSLRQISRSLYDTISAESCPSPFFRANLAFPLRPGSSEPKNAGRSSSGLSFRFQKALFEILSENCTDLSTQDSEGHPCQGQHELPCAAAVILPVIAGSIKKQENRPEYRPQKASHRKHQGFYLAKETPDNYGAGIPLHEAEVLARVLFLMMQKFFEREEGQREGGVESPTECRAAETGMTKAGAS